MEQQNIKLGLGICAFDASEHLINILEELKPYIDYAVIALQDYSYHGEPIDPIDEAECFRLVEEGWADEVIKPRLDESLAPREQETQKRNLILDTLEAKGCTHSLIIDSDEFFKASQFKKAFDKVVSEGIDLSYCQYLNYFGDYQHYLVYPFKEGCYVPFISKSSYRFKYETTDWGKPSDPTRRYVRKRDSSGEFSDNLYEFPWKELNMHHLSWIRCDISKKLENWSSKKCFSNYLFLTDKSIERYNEFLETGNIEEGATLLFNTPDNKVDIVKLPKQYIKPKHDIRKFLENRNLSKSPKKVMLAIDLDSFGSNLNKFMSQNRVREVLDAYKRYADASPNVDVCFFKSTKSFKSVENECINIYCSNAKTSSWSRLTGLLKHFKENGLKHEWTVRLDVGSFVNINALTKLLDSNLLDKRKLYGGQKVSSFHSMWESYCTEEALLISNIYAEKILQTYNSEIESTYVNTGDILMSAIINSEYMKVKLKSRDSMQKALGLQYLFNGTESDLLSQNGDELMKSFIFFKDIFSKDLEFLEKSINKTIETDIPDFSDLGFLKGFLEAERDVINIKNNKESWIINKLDELDKSEIYHNCLLWGSPERIHTYKH